MFPKVTILASLAIASSLPRAGTHTGWAKLWDPGFAACGVVDGAYEYTASLPIGLFYSVCPYPGCLGDDNPLCGAGLTVTAPNGNSVEVFVADSCLNCGNDDIGLSQTVFSELGYDSYQDIPGVRWEF